MDRIRQKVHSVMIFFETQTEFFSELRATFFTQCLSSLFVFCKRLLDSPILCLVRPNGHLIHENCRILDPCLINSRQKHSIFSEKSFSISAIKFSINKYLRSIKPFNDDILGNCH